MRLAILGCGAVGQSVANLADEYGHEVVALADSTTAAVKPSGINVEKVLQRKTDGTAIGSKTPGSVFETEYDILIEATPTTLNDAEPGFTHIKRALEADRHVVLANKGPVAERYGELRALEADSAGALRFEATVGAAIPILSTIEDCTPQAVTAVRGVLNGTANFILTRMAAEGVDYEHVLAEAQDLGVAEADPTFDVDGTDAALKFVILANVLSDGGFSFEDAHVSGVEDIPGSALELAAEDGRTIRLIGEATRNGVRVGPRLVPEHSTLAVTGTRNIVEIETKHAGSLHNSGPGAGGPETASAVLADIDRISKSR